MGRTLVAFITILFVTLLNRLQIIAALGIASLRVQDRGGVNVRVVVCGVGAGGAVISAV